MLSLLKGNSQVVEQLDILMNNGIRIEYSGLIKNSLEKEPRPWASKFMS
jgi:hypothetical protein